MIAEEQGGSPGRAVVGAGCGSAAGAGAGTGTAAASGGGGLGGGVCRGVCMSVQELSYCLCLPCCCTVLLQHGADPNIRNTDGKSALDLAEPSAKAVLTGQCYFPVVSICLVYTVCICLVVRLCLFLFLVSPRLQAVSHLICPFINHPVILQSCSLRLLFSLIIQGCTHIGQYSAFYPFCSLPPSKAVISSQKCLCLCFLFCSLFFFSFDSSHG